jgi:hypothetical protein
MCCGPGENAETRLYFHRAGLGDHVGIFSQAMQDENLYQEAKILTEMIASFLATKCFGYRRMHPAACFC